MKLKVRKKLQVILCMVLSCTMLTGCVFTGPVQDMGSALGRFIKAYNEALESEDGGEILASVETEDKPEPSSESEDVPESTTESTEESTTESSTDEPSNDRNIDAETIMIYMVGSDLESEYGNATLDLEEMMAADVDTEYNNVVVYTGGAAEWQIDGLSAYENSTLLLTDSNDFEIIDSHSSRNMGEADTLSSFINYCYDNFESENYSLVLWNHGAGPVFGFGIDENYEDLLTADEMKTAFEDSVGARGERLEWVGFDACLMNSLEMADLLANYSNYMIASQETEPGWGWNYEFLSETSDAPMSGEDMGKAIIDTYMQYGDMVFALYPRMYCDLTLSCIDLNQYQAAEDALDSCFAELDEGLTIENYPQLVRDREDTRDFGTYASSFDYGMVDAIHLLGQIAPGSPSAIQAIRAIEEMVVYSDSNMNNANGISICYPYSSSDGYAEACVAIQEELDFSYGYRGFLDKFYSIQNGDRLATDWDFASAKTAVETIEADTEYEVDTSDISLQLTEEQQANYASADYLILAKVDDAGYADVAEDDPRGEEMYMFIHRGKNVEVDENGVLHGYYGNQVMYLHDLTDDAYPSVPMILIEQDRTDEEVRYTCGTVLNNWNIEDDFSNWTSEAANLQIVVNDENPNGIIRSAVPIADEEETNPSKQLLDLDDFGIMEIFARASYVTRDENGNLVDFFSWEESGWLLGFDQDLRNDYQLEMRPLEDPENYVCLFRIKDAQGNVSYSELIPLG